MTRVNDPKITKEELRKIRGYSIIAKGDTPEIVNEETFILPSQADHERRYTITHRQTWTCTCPDFLHRNIECKHIQAVKVWLQLRNKIDDNTLELENELLSNEIQCEYCNSFNVVKDGKRKTKQGFKQKYLCKDCNGRFVIDPVKKHKATGKLISLTIDLYFKGMSYRKISDTIHQFYDLELDHTTIMRWIDKFMKKMNDYTNQFKPDLSKTWEADEQMINSKGEYIWSWNVMDKDTRFLIANMVSKERKISDARKIFKKAKENAKGKTPDKVITDGLQSYQSAVRKEFYSRRKTGAKHERLRTIKDKVNNNIIERYHGNWRERDKVMRGLEDKENAQDLLEYYRTYYNFLRKHQGLENITPAQMAGIHLNLHRNRTYDLLKRSLSSD